MSSLLDAFSVFHFLRPAWLLLLVPILLLWWSLRRDQRSDAATSGQIAPHLARALAVGDHSRRRFRPIDLIALLLTLLTLGTAGPSWTRLPDPLMAKTTPLVVVLKVSDSMTEKDVPPERLARAKQKVLDLLETRDGAPTALVAYAGSAHRVVPLTEDQDLLRPYLEGLNPEVMPVPGENAATALKLAEQILAKDETPGGILFLLDSLSDGDASALSQRTDTNGLGLLLVAPGNENGGAVSKVRNAKVERVTPDKSDLRALNRYFDSAFRQALASDKNLQWEDRGWWLAWPAALLALLWFRRGWALRGRINPNGAAVKSTGAIVILVLLPFIPDTARAQGSEEAEPTTAGGILGLLLTPDQQGQWFSYRENYRRAAASFLDPYRKGYALYQAGQFEDAANVLAEVNTPEAIFTRAMAMTKTGQYEGAIAAFQQVLQFDPEFPGARENLEITKKILAYMEASRGEEEEKLEQSDEEGEESDFEQEQVPQEQEVAKKDNPVSPDQWMSTLDTGTSEYLKQRFAAEAAGGSGNTNRDDQNSEENRP
ncbi:VWA domain-containing protein [Microbulbifer sp. CAU 1566]|uniref:vWA domain-containing protein n=1 Tax=Microbulbifer sp. CAU 1566 TaxID=2933269 RepID=UPI002002FC3C|nr:VWA domain-containing protein [Microbulbifer sp. CAU 1566]MCK7597664.1 VWA domain-containing protein [Microbulbifer sp. CAU 1566]